MSQTRIPLRNALTRSLLFRKTWIRDHDSVAERYLYVQQVCATISTAYVHGGRQGLLPETILTPAGPPSRWHPLVPTPESDGATDFLSADASAAKVQVSIPGLYLDLDTELTYARVRL